MRVHKHTRTMHSMSGALTTKGTYRHTSGITPGTKSSMALFCMSCSFSPKKSCSPHGHNLPFICSACFTCCAETQIFRPSLLLCLYAPCCDTVSRPGLSFVRWLFWIAANLGRCCQGFCSVTAKNKQGSDGRLICMVSALSTKVQEKGAVAAA